MSEETYPHRSMIYYKDESKHDHNERMKKAAIYPRVMKSPLTITIAELLVWKDSWTFSKQLGNLGMKFVSFKGYGKNSFRIEMA
jgi:hypothetical protein